METTQTDSTKNLTSLRIAAVCILLITAALLMVTEGILKVLGKAEHIVVRAGWRFQGPRVEMNDLGFRGQKIEYGPNDTVVVLLGDSQVQADACSYDWMPERRLEFYLSRLSGKSVKCFTLGADGYGHDQQLLVLKEYFRRYRADIVLGLQTPTNDVWNNMFPTHWPINGTPKPTYWLEDHKMMGPKVNMGDIFYENHKWRLVNAFLQLFGHKHDPDHEWAAVYLPEPYKPLDKFDGLVDKEWQKTWDEGEESRTDLKGLPLEKSHATLFLSPISPRTIYGIELSNKLLITIKEEVEKNGAHFIAFAPRLPWMEAAQIAKGTKVNVLNGKYYPYSTKQFIENMEAIVKDVSFLVVPFNVEKYRVGPTDSHLNEHAQDSFMENLAKMLLDKPNILAISGSPSPDM